MQQNKPSGDQLNTKVALYTAIAGTLFSGAALAVPTMSNVSGFSTTVDDQNNNHYPVFDIDGDGVNDFTLYTWWSGFTYCTDAPGNSYIYGQQDNTMLTDDDGYGGMIGAGTPVPGTLFPVGYYLNFASCYQETEFAPNAAGYAGFQFDIGDNTHYGYMRVGTSQTEASLTTTIYEVCYESTPGASIQAGDCAPKSIPVGGLIPISLGVLATGAFALRRRRKHLN